MEKLMRQDEYVLSEDEYEVVDTGEPEPIRSETVKRKLDSPYDEIIEQDDFHPGPGLSEYFSLDKEQYPRNLSGNGAKVAGTASAGAVYSVGAYASGQETLMLATLGLPVAMYLEGLMHQDLSFEEALGNTRESLSR